MTPSSDTEIITPANPSPPVSVSSPQKRHTSQGHRLRLLDRYLKNGSDSLHPHEILELLLTFVVKRKDTKETARALLDRFHTIGGVCNASVEELQRIDGIGRQGAGLLVLIRDILAVCLKERYERKSVLSHRDDVEAYLRIVFGNRPDEYIAALFLDTANHVIETRIIAEGTVNQCAIYPRTVFEKALQYHASSFIIAHNHPAGTAKASEGDWQITERLFNAGKMLDLPLLDHIIICTQQVVSLREMARWPGRESAR